MFRKLIFLIVNKRLSEDMETSWSASTTPGSKVPVLSRAETKLVRNRVCWDLGRSCQAARLVSDRRLEAGAEIISPAMVRAAGPLHGQCFESE